MYKVDADADNLDEANVDSGTVLGMIPGMIAGMIVGIDVGDNTDARHEPDGVINVCDDTVDKVDVECTPEISPDGSSSNKEAFADPNIDSHSREFRHHENRRHGDEESQSPGEDMDKDIEDEEERDEDGDEE